MTSNRFGTSSEEVRGPIEVSKEVVSELVPHPRPPNRCHPPPPPQKKKRRTFGLCVFLCPDFRIKLDV